MGFWVGLSIYIYAFLSVLVCYFFWKIHAKEKIHQVRELKKMIVEHQKDLKEYEIVIGYLIDELSKIKQLCRENNIEAVMGQITNLEIKRYDNKGRITEKLIQKKDKR